MTLSTTEEIFAGAPKGSPISNRAGEQAGGVREGEVDGVERR